MGKDIILNKWCQEHWKPYPPKMTQDTVNITHKIKSKLHKFPYKAPSLLDPLKMETLGCNHMEKASAHFFHIFYSHDVASCWFLKKSGSCLCVLTWALSWSWNHDGSWRGPASTSSTRSQTPQWETCTSRVREWAWSHLLTSWELQVQPLSVYQVYSKLSIQL